MLHFEESFDCSDSLDERIDLGAVKIGHDLLQLISSSMYVEPLTLYREYIQNAADSVDEARSCGMLAENDPGVVTIDPDPLTRSIRIRDNGLGLANTEFAARLRAIGASQKRRLSLRGFRGIGRLVGLGYSQSLIFRSRSSPAEEVLELTWDCKALRDLLRSADDHQIQEVISNITSLKAIKGNWPDHFFEVELVNVVRHMDDQLLNHQSVSDYLSQVAPVPFDNGFLQAESVRRFIGDHVALQELQIRINGATQQVLKPYKSNFSSGENKKFNICEIQEVLIPALDDGIAALGWIAHHEYLGAIPRNTGVGGIRVREGNIQVGVTSLLEDAFAEPRFNAWCIGEIHVVDRRIIPNGRRDNFEPNVHYGNFINHFSTIARELSKRCRSTSVNRNIERRFKSAELELRMLVDQASKRAQSEVILLNARQRGEFLLLQMKLLSDKVFDRSTSEKLALQCAVARKDIEKLNSIVRRRAIKGRSARTRGQLDVLESLYEATNGRFAEDGLVTRVLSLLENRR